MESLIILAILWTSLSVALAILGKNKKPGFGPILIISLVLSPLAGLIVVYRSGNKQTFAINVSLTEDYFEKGLSNFNREKFKEALDYFNKVIKLDPMNSSAYNNRGKVKYECGDNEEALADFNKAIEINPEDSKAYLNRGRTRLVLYGNDERAVSDLKKARDLGNKEALKMIIEMGVKES